MKTELDNSTNYDLKNVSQPDAKLPVMCRLTPAQNGVNINKFIRQAIAEKIKADWKKIKAEKTTFHCPF